MMKSFDYQYCNLFQLDINECSTRNGGCEHVCINSIGSFHCECRPGHVLDYNHRTCSGTIRQTIVYETVNAYIVALMIVGISLSLSNKVPTIVTIQLVINREVDMKENLANLVAMITRRPVSYGS